MGKGLASLVIFSVMFIFVLSIVSAADYRNAYVIMWDGTACDNVAYAKSMGYDYVGYMPGMENCADNSNLYFYIESPEQKPAVINNYVYLDKSYTAAEKQTMNDMLLWKSTATFPNNIATGWYFSSNYFRPLADFQQQSVIDYMVTQSIALIANAENKQNNFLFGGWSWDVPNLGGDLWSGIQNRPILGQTGTGKQVDISYWTNSCSGIKHPGLPQDYACYTDGKAAFYKELFSETRKLYPNMKIYVEPFIPWTSYIQIIASRSDVAQLKPDLVCEESGGNEFVTEPKLFTSGLMTKDKMCSDTPNVFDHKGNLVIAGNAGINGAWFLWYGRLGGTGNFPNYASIRQIPDRLKLIRAMPGWDNLNNVPLSSRSWSATKNQYSSTLSLANMSIIYSVHPKNKNTYFVILDKATGMPLQGKTSYTVYSVDDLFQQKAVATSDFTVKNGNLYLNSDTNVGKGYIITSTGSSTPPVTPPPVIPPVTPPATNKTNTTTSTACSDTDGGNDTFTKGIVTYKDTSGKTSTYTDTCSKTGSISKIREYYCLNGKYKDGNYTCKNGCTNGACIPDAVPVAPPPQDTSSGSGSGSSSGSSSSSSGSSSDLSASVDETTIIGPYCGDNICNANEDCKSCSGDCGACKKTVNPPKIVNSHLIEPNDNNASVQQEMLKAADSAVKTGIDKSNEMTGLLIKDDNSIKGNPVNIFSMITFLMLSGGLVFYAIRWGLAL